MLALAGCAEPPDGASQPLTLEIGSIDPEPRGSRRRRGSSRPCSPRSTARRAPEAVTLAVETGTLAGGGSTTLAVDGPLRGRASARGCGCGGALRWRARRVACAGDALHVPGSATLGAEDAGLEVTVSAAVVEEATAACVVASLTPAPRCDGDADAVVGVRSESRYSTSTRSKRALVELLPFALAFRVPPSTRSHLPLLALKAALVPLSKTNIS